MAKTGRITRSLSVKLAKGIFIRSLILLLLIVPSCNSGADKFSGIWSIEDYGSEYKVLTSGLLLEPDGTCDMPMDSAVKDFKTRGKGTWSVLEKEDGVFLVFRCKAMLFNDTFEVKDFHYQDNGPGYDRFKIMTIQSDKIILKCATWVQ